MRHNFLVRFLALQLCWLLPAHSVVVINSFRFGAPPSTYLINQNFEGTGYDNGETWTPTGTPDPDYTTTVLKGAQSFRTFGVNYAQISFTGQTDVYFHCRLRLIAAPNVANTTIQLVNTAETVLAGLHLTVATNIDTKLNSNGGVLTAASLLTGALATTYYLWLEYHSGGTCVLKMGTTTTRPTTDESTTAYLSQAGAVDSCTKILIYSGGGAGDMIVDNVLISTTAIGDNPNP